MHYSSQRILSSTATASRHLSTSLKSKKKVFNFQYGPGGRSSNSGITATVFGGYGFVGRYFVNELGMCGSRVYAPYRGCELEVRHLKPMFDLGQLGLMPFSPRDKESIVNSIKNSDIVINLIGKHYETKHLVPTRRDNGKLSNVNYGLEEVNVEVAGTIAELCKEAGVKSFIHVSALSADENSASQWNRTKALGEQAVRSKFPEAIIVKLATVFGPEDRFLTLIGEAMARLPFFPLINDGQTLVQPVYVNDVGSAMMEIVRNHEEFAGKTFQLAGPAEYTYKEVVEFVSDLTTLKTTLVDVPPPIAETAGSLLEFGFTPILTKDAVLQMQEDVLLKEDCSLLTFKDLGMDPTSMDKVAFDFLHRFRPGGHFTIVQGYH